MKIIEDETYYQLIKHPDSKKLLVIFSSLDTKSPKFTFWKMAQSLECNCLFFNSPMTHWYRTGIIGIPNGIKGTCEKIADIRKNLNIEEMIFFGVSMGGYGAILYGSLTKADHVIVFSVEPLLGLPGGKTEVTRNHLQPIYPDLRVLDIPKTTLIYGEMDIPDSIGAFLLSQSCKNIKIFRLPYAEHDVANSLNYRNELKPLLESLINNESINIHSLKSGAINERSYLLLHKLRNDYINHRWEKTVQIIEEDKNLLEESPLLHFIYSVCNYKTGKFKTAKSHLIMILSKEREFSQAWNLLSSCEFKLGRYSEAVTAATIAIQLKPQYSLFHITKSMALKKLGDFKGAYEEAKISGMLNVQHKNYIDEINKLEEHLKKEKSTIDSITKERDELKIKNKLNSLFGNSAAKNFDLTIFEQ